MINNSLQVSPQPGECVVIVTDWGGRVEELKLTSHSTGELRDVLLTHHGSQALIEGNKWWKGMLLMPWANRVAFVSQKL